jgi:hypothetical protein
VVSEVSKAGDFYLWPLFFVPICKLVVDYIQKKAFEAVEDNWFKSR